jgi:UDP-glucose 4-epimerase
MKKVLVTGAAGLLGSHFSHYLLDNGYDCIGIDNLSGGYKDFVDKRIIKTGQFYKIDLADPKLLKSIFKKHRPDFVYHFAAYAAEGLSPFIRNYNYSNNLLCSVNVINNCISYDVKKIIFTSSMAVYGHGSPPFTEKQLPSPADPYGIAKYCVELDLKQAYDQFGLPFSIARPHNVIGINQNIWDRYRNVIGIWIRRSLNGKSITVFGDGKQKRAFSDIRYYMKPFEVMMTKADTEVFNLGADREYELGYIAQLVQKVAKEFGFKPKIEFLEKRNEVKDAFCSHEKAKKLLGFQDHTDIEVTIREMFAWAIRQPARKVKSMSYEVDKNMYSFWK